MEGLFYIFFSISLALSLVYSSQWEDAEETHHLPGHMQPLGSHRPMEGEIERIDYVPDPVTFYEKFVERLQPVILEEAIANTWVLEMWTDDYLRDNFGDDEVMVELNKIEDRSEPPSSMKLEDFLDNYRHRDEHVVSEVLDAMKDELFFPGSIGCGGYLENVYKFLIRFSSGGTKSVLHADFVHNMHCVVSGEKRFVMIPPEYAKVIGPEWEGRGYYNLDVEAVNMTAYPKMVDVPWYKAVLSPGDCMYLPFHWIHHVSSFHRNIGVNLWFNHFLLNTSNCSEHKPSNLFPLKGVNTTAENAVNVLFTTQPREDGLVYLEDAYRKMQSHTVSGVGPVPKVILEAVFETISPGSQGMIGASEFREAKGDSLMELTELFTSLRHDNMMEEDEDFLDYPTKDKSNLDRHDKSDHDEL